MAKKTVTAKTAPASQPNIFGLSEGLPTPMLCRLPLKAIEGWQQDGADRWSSEQVDAERTEKLATAIAQVGQLQPIMVQKTVLGEYQLVFGRRRCRAMDKLGMRDIAAYVVDNIAPLRDDVRRAIIAQENIQRDNLSPVEESMAIRDLIDLFVPELTKGMTDADANSPTVRRQCIPKVAAALGQSEEWVRDRYYIAALGPTGCSLVRQGKLPLSHAREIAKVLDAKRREELAIDYAVGGKEGNENEPGSLDALRHEVSRKLMSLAQAPWKLDAQIGDLPLCTTCPKNSENSPGLFEGTDLAIGDRMIGDRAVVPYGTGKYWEKLHQDGVCRDLACFRKKLVAAKQATAAYAAKVVAGKDVDPPAFVERKDLKKAVQAKADRAGNRAKTTGSKDRDHEDSWERQREERTWREGIVEKIDAEIAKNPWGLAYLNLFGDYSIKDPERLREARDATEEWLIEQLKRFVAGKQNKAYEINTWSRSNATIVRMAALFGIKAEPPTPEKKTAKKAVRK